jgi:hypothetical protein
MTVQENRLYMTPSPEPASVVAARQLAHEARDQPTRGRRRRTHRTATGDVPTRAGQDRPRAGASPARRDSSAATDPAGESLGP